MGTKEQMYRSLSTLCILTFMYLQTVLSETVYMDKYGDCFHEGAIEVGDESYTIQAQGGAAYDTLNCEITFKSTKNDRLCLSFKEFEISRCDLKLYAYSDQTSDNNNNIMGTYTCHTDDHPETVCSDGKYLTVLMQKQGLTHDGYDFTLKLRQYSQSDAFADGIDAFIVSISVIVGIIVGVIVIVVLTAVIIVCCCCKNKSYGGIHTSRHKSSTSCRATDYTNVQPVQPIQPTAPPLDAPPAYSEHPPPYTDNSATIPLNSATIPLNIDTDNIPIDTENGAIIPLNIDETNDFEQRKESV